ncbi:MAG TPA: chemotaxis protein CheW [Gemmatimonadales bacterium]|jgi:chemotaxis signal transduction protein
MTERGPGRVVVCRVGEERFAVSVTSVREILAAPELTRIPGVSTAVRGLANVRGTLVTAMSGRGLLGLPGPDSGDWLLVLSTRDGRVGVVMDEVEDLHEEAGATALPVLDIEALVLPLLASEQDRA